MDTSNHLCAIKEIKGQSCENAIEEKNDPSTMNLDKTNKNLIANDNHSNNLDTITKAKKKMNEYENIKSDKVIESIKSPYVLKDIFSFLSEKQKLEIIIYNKNLQKNFDINIENYKRIRGIYREGERNGKGKEYYISNNLIIFEGEYKNGKRNGKGKEYFYNGDLEFKGEYKNGKRNGKGEEYFYNGDLEYKGEYKNGKRNGKGKQYYYNGKLEYEGEYLNGIWNGKGKEYYDNGNLKYDGEYLNGERNGKGKKYNKNGKLIFEGGKKKWKRKNM